MENTNNTGIPVSKSEWEEVLQTMNFYKRTDGWVAKLDHKLRFFDAKPSEGGMHVYKGDVETIIKNYNE